MMAIKYGNNKTTSSAKLKVGLAVLAGLVVVFVAGNWWNWSLAPLLGWDTAAIVYASWVWGQIWNMDGQTTADHALREDPSRSVADTILLIASTASLIAVGVVLSEAQKAQGAGQLLLILLGIASVVVAWLLVHTVFALRYAEMFYDGTPGGVQFDGTPKPSYHDFAYLAFTVGMTFQVSDTGFTSTEFRRTALHHALISYLFGTVIVATTINLIAGLTK
jgi:uncharacterized membrane protein